MTTHPTLFITHRGERHQQAALDAAPAELDVTLRRSPSKDEIIALLPGKEFLITERSGEIDADIIRAGHDLRLIQRLGAQTHDIDLDAARAAGIPVCYSVGVGLHPRGRAHAAPDARVRQEAARVDRRHAECRGFRSAAAPMRRGLLRL